MRGRWVDGRYGEGGGVWGGGLLDCLIGFTLGFTAFIKPGEFKVDPDLLLLLRAMSWLKTGTG